MNPQEDRLFFLFRGCCSSHVIAPSHKPAAMSCRCWTVRWWASVAAVFLFLLLDEKEPKNQGRHHRTQHTKRTLPRHVGRGPRAQPSQGLAFPHSTRKQPHLFHFGTSAAGMSSLRKLVNIFRINSYDQ